MPTMKKKFLRNSAFSQISWPVEESSPKACVRGYKKAIEDLEQLLQVSTSITPRLWVEAGIAGLVMK